MRKLGIATALVVLLTLFTACARSNTCSVNADCLGGERCVSGTCSPVCAALSATCAKCLDNQTKQACMNVANAGKADPCDAENQLLAGFCK